MAVLACDPPVGRTNQPGTEVPGEEMWFTFPPPPPLPLPAVPEVLAVEHPAPATARSSSNPIGMRRVRRESIPKKDMSPPVPIFGLCDTECLPNIWESPELVIILRATSGQASIFFLNPFKIK